MELFQIERRYYWPTERIADRTQIGLLTTLTLARHMTGQKLVMHLEYDYAKDDELAMLINAMHKFSKEQLRCWLIQELANFGHERWEVIEIGTQVLKAKAIVSGADLTKIYI